MLKKLNSTRFSHYDQKDKKHRAKQQFEKMPVELKNLYK
jgi:hypothetical protein